MNEAKNTNARPPSGAERKKTDNRRKRRLSDIFDTVYLKGVLIGAVLSISGAFSVGAVPAALTGNPSTDYSTHTLLLHIQDYSASRLELGYASAVAVILFVIMITAWVGLRKLLSSISGD